MRPFSPRPSIPARILTDIEWIKLAETPYNPPGPELSEDDFEAEFEAAETGVIAVLEQFGRNSAEDGVRRFLSRLDNPGRFARDLF